MNSCVDTVGLNIDIGLEPFLGLSGQKFPFFTGPVGHVT